MREIKKNEEREIEYKKDCTCEYYQCEVCILEIVIFAFQI